MVNRWAIFLAGRYIRAGKTENKRTTQHLSIAGLAAGVITLTAVMSIMNGLQTGFINDILEIESYHIRINNVSVAMADNIKEVVSEIDGVSSSVVFFDVQTMLRGTSSRLEPVLVRMFDEAGVKEDKSMFEHLGISMDNFQIAGGGKAVIGGELARFLQVSKNDTINLLSLSGNSFASLRPDTITLDVTGIFQSGYYEFDRSMIFLSLEHAKNLNPGNMGEPNRTIGIKLDNQYRDTVAMAKIKSAFPEADIISWREYNKSFFGALRLEKITMMFLIALIFLVMGVNIFNSIKRTVAGKLEDIAVLYAVGASEKDVKNIFLAEGIIIGLSGAIIGVTGGLLIMININEIFDFAGRAISFLTNTAEFLTFSAGFGGGTAASFTLFPEDYFYLTEIPVEIFLPETILIFIFAFLSAVLSAWFASKKLSVKNPAEYLRYE